MSSRRSGRQKKKHEYGQSWMLAAALLDGPRTIEELEEYYRTMGRRFGVFTDLVDREPPFRRTEDKKQQKTKMRLNMERSLSILLQRGWAVEKDGTYNVTDEGREEAQLMLNDLERGGRMLEKGTRPETVSKATLIVHFVLAAVKLPAALLSGSVGLLNDSLDTLMDGVSSLFVFFGIRSGRERLVSYILLLFMMVTGGYTFYKALSRLIHPQPLTADLTAFTAVAVSACLCALLWLYQKYSGLKHGCVPLIAQSIDSRNHIIVAGGVAAGLAAAAFKFILLDQIVGIAVSFMIIKGALDLMIDLLRSRGDEELDLSKYGFSRLGRFRHIQTLRWLLYEIKKGRITTKDELLGQAKVATDFKRIASLKALGLDEQPDQENKLKKAIEDLFDKGFAEEKTMTSGYKSPQEKTFLQLTPAGENELNLALSNPWRSSVRFPSFPRNRLLIWLAFFVRIIISAALFTGIYALGRWLIGLFPPQDIWDTGSWLSSVWPSLKNILLSTTFRAGPFPLNGAQGICFLLGLMFFYNGRRLLHKSSHLIHHAREDRSSRPYYLITEGPFSFCRHPMYAGILLINMGIGIGLHSVYTLAWAGMVLFIQYFSVRLEEKKLSQWFARDYEKYAAHVKRRFLPWWAWLLVLTAYIAAWIGI
ncbi:MAG: cation transporter [Candidatus Aminicenantes bacterium]|nr:cation transporter [Candidatus Aminicenantes bacterium]